MFTGKIGHLEIESPWGNAGGVVKSIDEVEKMAHTGVGWIEAGSYTLEPRVGNSPEGERVYFHNDKTGETFNSLGMPNKGMDELEKQIPEMVGLAHELGKSIIFNVAPTSNDPAEESKELVERVYSAGAEAVLLNAGCPNVVTENGGRHELLSRNPAVLLDVLNALKPITKEFKPIFIRTSPVENFVQANDMIRAIIKSSVVSAVFTPNTWPGHRPIDEDGVPVLQVPGNIGGLSGPSTAGAARDQAAWAGYALTEHNSNIDLVSSAGIMNGKELKRRLGIGAVAGCGTTLYYESAAKDQTWASATDKLLREHTDTL